MSMIGNFLQLTPSELDALIANPADVESFIYPDEDENENCIDIDKAWHGIHFMLTGTQYDGDPPLSNVIFSGVTIGDDVGYGPARYLTANEVAEVAEALRPCRLTNSRSDTTPRRSPRTIYIRKSGAVRKTSRTYSHGTARCVTTMPKRQLRATRCFSISTDGIGAHNMVFTLGLRHTFAVRQRSLALIQSLVVQASFASFMAVS